MDTYPYLSTFEATRQNIEQNPNGAVTLGKAITPDFHAFGLAQRLVGKLPNLAHLPAMEPLQKRRVGPHRGMLRADTRSKRVGQRDEQLAIVAKLKSVKKVVAKVKLIAPASCQPTDP